MPGSVQSGAHHDSHRRQWRHVHLAAARQLAHHLAGDGDRHAAGQQPQRGHRWRCGVHVADAWLGHAVAGTGRGDLRPHRFRYRPPNRP